MRGGNSGTHATGGDGCGGQVQDGSCGSCGADSIASSNVKRGAA